MAGENDPIQLPIKRATGRQIALIIAACGGAGLVGGGSGVATTLTRLAVVETQVTGLKDAVVDLTIALRESGVNAERLARLEANVENLKNKGPLREQH